MGLNIFKKKLLSLLVLIILINHTNGQINNRIITNYFGEIDSSKIELTNQDSSIYVIETAFYYCELLKENSVEIDTIETIKPKIYNVFLKLQRNHKDQVFGLSHASYRSSFLKEVLSGVQLDHLDSLIKAEVDPDRGINYLNVWNLNFNKKLADKILQTVKDSLTDIQFENLAYELYNPGFHVLDFWIKSFNAKELIIIGEEPYKIPDMRVDYICFMPTDRKKKKKLIKDTYKEFKVKKRCLKSSNQIRLEDGSTLTIKY